MNCFQGQGYQTSSPAMLISSEDRKDRFRWSNYLQNIREKKLYSNRTGEDPTECVTDLDLRSELIFCETILTTFEASIIFWGHWGSSGNWLEPKNKPLLRILTKLSFSKSVMRCGYELLVSTAGISTKLYHFRTHHKLFYHTKRTSLVSRYLSYWILSRLSMSRRGPLSLDRCPHSNRNEHFFPN